MNKCVKCNKETDELSYDNYCIDCFRKGAEFLPSKTILNIIEFGNILTMEEIIHKVNDNTKLNETNISEEFIKEVIRDSLEVGLIIENNEGLIKWNINAKSVMKP